MEEKKSKKKVIFLILLIVIIVFIAIVAGYFGYKFWESNQTVGTEWGDIYLEYLKDKKSNGEYSEAKDSTIQFVQLEENQEPAMVLSYEKDEDKFMDISIIKEDGELKTKRVQAENGAELDLEILYDIKNEQYNWYEHEKKQDESELFIQLNQTDIENETEPTEDKKHEFTKEEMEGKETAEGEIPSIPKFDEEFIKPEVEENKTDIDLNGEIDEKEIKDKMTQAVEDYTPQDQIITDEVKENVENSLKELETKKEEIKKAKEEKAKKEAEEKAKAEAEAKKKAAEEAAKGLKVGSIRLKYGKYVSDVSQMDSSMYGTLILRPNGKFHIKANCEGNYPYKTLDCDGTYKVTKVENSMEYFDGIKFTTNTGVTFALMAYPGNTLSDQWHGYKYVGSE